jgi:hypothetical protein
LAAHQGGLGRDSDDVGVVGEADRGQETHVSQSCDDDAFADHALILRGTSCPVRLLLLDFPATW